MIYVGIDPGLNGGIVAINDNIEIILKEKMPTIKKQELDYKTIKKILTNLKEQNAFFALEEVHAIYNSSAAATFKFGGVFEAMKCALYLLDCRFVLVKPKEWQNVAWKGITKIYKTNNKKKTVDTKATSRTAAKQIFPNENFLTSSKSKNPHDGLIDAALIAFYLKIHLSST